MAMLLVACALTQAIFPFGYSLGLADPLHPLFGALVLARSGLLVAWAALLLGGTSRR